MRLLLLGISFLLLSSLCFAQNAVHRRIVVLGNAGEALQDHPALAGLIRRHIPLDSGTILLFLGNAVRHTGDTASLLLEVAMIEGTEAKAFFVPGYAEWDHGGRDGWKAVKAQGKFLKSLNNKNVAFYPGKGCPGPEEVKLGNDALMVIMDSQWWLQRTEKPGVESDCDYRSNEEILAEIEDLPKDKIDKLVLFVSFHPMVNTGLHSGTFGLKQHLFPLTDIRGMDWAYLPLPLAGSLYPVTRNAIADRQDGNSDLFRSFSTEGFRTLDGVQTAFSNHPHTIYLAGQEHNLQLLQEGGQYFINGGATGRPSRVRDGRGAVYTRQQAGFTVLEIGEDKSVRSRFFLIEGDTLHEDFSRQLLSYASLPQLGKDTARTPAPQTDSISVAADKTMNRVGGLKRFLIGNNYRQEWSQPVRMPVFRAGEVMGGMEIKGIGGGHESRSLELEDSAGNKWALRSMNKHLAAVIPEGFQNTVASEYLQDMLSASEPYAALVVPALERPLGIVHATPYLYFIPNDSSMGPFRPLLANQVALLEPKKPTLNGDKADNSTEALNDMIESGDHFTDQEAYLRTRLVDFLLADFDRHHGQYSWGYHDSEGRRWYYPIPKDRDQAAYHNEGLIIRVMKHGNYRFMTNFPYRLGNIKNNGIVGSYVDMLFTNKLTEADWERNIALFRGTLSDPLIDSAMLRLPPEIGAIGGAELAAKLKRRRESVADKGLHYYRYIARRVNVLGGNGDDRFYISSNDSGLQVRVVTKGEDGQPLTVFERTFDPAVTKEIRLFGFNGDDRFIVDEAARSGIHLRMIGGSGKDSFWAGGRIRKHLYDLSYEDNEIVTRRRSTRMFSRFPSVNEFQLREPRRASFSLPSVSVAINQDDGLMAGAGIAYTTYGFRRYPFSTRQSLSLAAAPGSRAWRMTYTGEFIDVFRHYDLLINADNYNPTLSYFFGFGNESYRDREQPIRYYRTRYSYLSDDILIRKRFRENRIVSIAAGPSFYYYWFDPERNKAHILETPARVGLSQEEVYEKKRYLGGKAVFTINSLDNDLLPFRGVYWRTEFSAMQSLNERSNSITKVLSTLDLYSTLAEPKRLLVGLHLGGGHIFSKDFEYFQALTLGGNNYLRGYRVSRFAGSSMFYASADIKVKLFSFDSYILKGDFGLVGFHDLGRVWMPGEVSDKWHRGWGGGLYLIPYNSVMLSVVAGVGEEETLFNASFGSRINMVFQGF